MHEAKVRKGDQKYISTFAFTAIAKLLAPPFLRFGLRGLFSMQRLKLWQTETKEKTIYGVEDGEQRQKVEN